MCTVSWQTAEQLENGELLLYFNRDEMRQRARGAEPEVFEQNGVSYLSPSDPERGGTWIAVNDRGNLVCLLNDYSVDFDYTGQWGSRGMLVRELAEFSKREEIWSYFSREDELNYPPFTLLFWDGAEMHQWHWDTLKLEYQENVSPPFTSSSWQTERVEAGRIALYQKWVTEKGASLASYHKHAIPGDAESSVCMSRELTQTVSLTSVLISDSKVQMRYTPRDQAGAFLAETNHTLVRA
jgi:uncharacterized protein with NRDE domain